MAPKLASSLARILWPDFLSIFSSTPQPPLRKTAYLDGLRGFASFMVYVLHHELWAHSALMKHYVLESAWGWNGNYYFAQLPFVRVAFTGGHIAVATFFILSGYVLTIKPLGLILKGDLLGLGDVLASSVFRRWVRLYVPIAIASIAYIVVMRSLGLEGTGFHKVEPNFGAQLWDWYIEFKHWSFIWDRNIIPWLVYNTHTWTIPYELKGSLLVWMVALCTARFSRTARWWIYGLLIFYFMWMCPEGWYCSYFMAGMWLAEIDLHAANGTLPAFFSKFERRKKTIFYGLFVLSMFLAGVPTANKDIEVFATSPGWVWLRHLKPRELDDPKWFFLFWGALALVPSVAQISWLKRFFETKFCQYLGRISFFLYLFHGPILAWLGRRVYAAVGFVRADLDDDPEKGIPSWCNIYPLSQAGPMGLEVNFLLSQLVLLPATLYLAELGTKLVDEPVVRNAQVLYKKLLASRPDDLGASHRPVNNAGSK